jgi:hypothetical protein
VHGLLDSEAAVALTAAALRALARGEARRAASAVDRLGELVVWSGWPHQGRGWVHVDLSRFAWRVRRRLERAAPARPRPAREPAAPLRVGLVGELARVVNFSTPQLAAVPDGVELSVFDLEIRGAHAEHLAALPRFTRLPALDGPAAVRRAAGEIDAAELDVLLVVTGPPDAYAIADAVATPCIANVCTGSDLLHHPRIAFNVFFQPQADYFVRDDHLFCGLCRAPFGPERVYDGFLVNDLRDIEPGPHAPWAAREPLLVFHGALYKAAAEPYLSTVLTLLAEDSVVEWILMGKDDGAARARIEAAALQHGVGGRVHYEGAYSIARRGADGRGVADEGWQRLLGHLARARLVPDPFPIPGGASRLEAYAMGVPVAHMALRTDRESWGRPQYAAFDLNGLAVAAGSVTTLAAYAALARRCLSDGGFADALVAEQLGAVERLTDAASWWRQILDFHERWRSGR